MSYAQIPLYRSMLFVPASHIERIPKAIASNADAVIVDLEDSVAINEKAHARVAVKAFLAKHPQLAVWVRVNAVDTPFYEEDITLCRTLTAVVGTVLPKAESRAHIETLAQVTQKPIIPIIETPLGLLQIADIAKAKGLQRLTYGGLDLAQALGSTPNTEGSELVMHQVRIQLLLHSTLNQLQPPLDTVYPDFNNLLGLEKRCRLVQEIGMAGMLCIHPKQIDTVHTLFTPSSDLLSWAKAIVDKADQSNQSVFQFNGQMVDAPVIKRARELLK